MSDLTAARARLDALAAEWTVTIDRVAVGERAVLAFGIRDGGAVVLKVSAGEADENHAADVLEAFDGRGVVRLFARAPGAWLLERAVPGRTLEDVVAREGDDEATGLMAATIERMTPGPAPAGVPAVGHWGVAFAAYQASGDTQIPAAVVSAAAEMYARLADTQRNERLLHGDLHHGNVVFDGERGWMAIDPKGVVGELEFELGAALRNPWDRPDLFSDLHAVRRRARRFAEALLLDESRVLGWACAQAVLADVWCVEDEGRVARGSPRLKMAQQLLESAPW